MSQVSQTTKKITVLKHYQQALIALGYNNQLLEEAEKGQQLILPLLMGGLPRDAKGRNRVLNIAFLPFEEKNDFKNLSMIQCYAAVPIPLDQKTQADVERLLILINNHLPIGYFGVSFQGNLYHRYVFTSEKWALPSLETLQEAFHNIHYVLDSFSPLIETLSEGTTSFEEVLKHL